MRLDRRSLFGLCALGAIALGGCASTDEVDGGHGTYALTAILIEGKGPMKDGSLRVLYRPPLETLYSCPGVNVIEEPEGTLIVTFVRSPKASPAPAQVPAVVDPMTGVAQVILKDAVNKRVFLKGGEWDYELWRHGGPIR